MTYRRFGHVQSRLLLEAQEDVRRLEQELDLLDFDDAHRDDGRTLDSKHWFSKERKDLMNTLRTAFNDYGELPHFLQRICYL